MHPFLLLKGDLVNTSSNIGRDNLKQFTNSKNLIFLVFHFALFSLLVMDITAP